MSEGQRLWDNGWKLIVVAAACGLMTRWLHTAQDVLLALTIMLGLMGLGCLLASRILHHTAKTGVMDSVLRWRFSRLSSHQIAPQRSRAVWRSAAAKLIAQMLVGIVLTRVIFLYGPSEPQGILSAALLTVLLMVSTAAIWGIIIGLWMLVISIAAPNAK